VICLSYELLALKSDFYKPVSAVSEKVAPRQHFCFYTAVIVFRSGAIKLQSLSNRLAMASGVPIQVSVDLPEAPGLNIREVADMARQAQVKLNAASQSEEELEFRKLLKAMGPKDVDNIDFIKKIQTSLKLSTG
jgi:hypothetical protein